MKRKYTEEFKIQVAKEYNLTGATLKDIADKYKTPFSTASTWGIKYRKHFSQALNPNQEAAIIVKSRDLIAAKLAIEHFGIQVIKPDNIIIEQQYVSKL